MLPTHWMVLCVRVGPASGLRGTDAPPPAAALASALSDTPCQWVFRSLRAPKPLPLLPGGARSWPCAMPVCACDFPHRWVYTAAPPRVARPHSHSPRHTPASAGDMRDPVFPMGTSVAPPGASVPTAPPIRHTSAHTTSAALTVATAATPCGAAVMSRERNFGFGGVETSVVEQPS